MINVTLFLGLCKPVVGGNLSNHKTFHVDHVADFAWKCIRDGPLVGESEETEASGAG